ncbi:ATP-binding cassette domain-containing protein [Kribbella sandramycini]|uniref:ATP-binding cassette domain-containing protein n=1 Tax=Kribbella sandramycini TaxID=60450 RepID=A0A7Y4NY54_9ACTN|nr:ATP-binding cassette domain-containing protein [Kribbella sandramycini]MBB6567922.1 peptide/nickel transport system ATP-binding protein [Kribbella sandramycini]NOL39483.1 ATP-binding cassette domain-containing protein [Kribbella sandramycini]
MLSAEGLWFRYHKRAPWILEDLSLTIEPGERVGLCGPSGAGKSTIGRLLAGYRKPSRGAITSDGPVQLVMQHPERTMNPHWRIRDVLAEAGSTVDEALVEPHWLDRFPHELSGGELQRVNLARALLAEPRYVIADEISASLDAITQAQLWHHLVEYAEAHGVGVLAISHDQDLIAKVTQRTHRVE